MLCLIQSIWSLGSSSERLNQSCLRRRKGGRLCTRTRALQAARMCMHISKTPVTVVKRGSINSTSYLRDTVPKHSHRDGAEVDNFQQHTLGVVIL